MTSFPISKNETPADTETDEADTDAWSDYRQHVTPLSPRYRNRVTPRPARPASIRRSAARLPVQETSPADRFNWNTLPSHGITRTEDTYRWSRHPVGRAQWRRWLAQHADHSIDLHGKTLDSAFHTIAACLHQASSKGFRLILCIHGKGLRSPQGESILRRALRDWLIHYPDVIAYSAAPANQGGDGATLIWIRLDTKKYTV